jgi:ketosteroid isomerase-like protein
MAGTDDMRDLLDRLYDSFNSGDSAAWTTSVAEDVLGVGSDPDEWWNGRSEVIAVTGTQIEEMAAEKVHFAGGAPHIVEQGDVVWAVDRPTISLPDGRSTQMRFTLIGSRDSGQLRIRHFHLSAGVPNEEHVGRALTTS